MSADVPLTGEMNEPGIVHLNRSSLEVLWQLVRDPLEALPPAAFEQRIAIGRAFGRTRAYVSDPALIQEVIVRKADMLVKGEDVTRALAPALGNGLLTADGAPWRRQRQTLAPAFQHDKLMTFLPPMIAAAMTTRDRWLALPPGTTLDVGHEMMMTTFQIIVDTMLSGPGALDAARVERGVTDYLKSTSWRFALSLLKAPTWTPFPGRRRARLAALFLRRTLRDMVVGRRRSDGREDLVALMLAAADPETGRTMQDEDIVDNILTFVTAGHETTAVALGWAFMRLAEEPHVLDRLLAEIETVTGGAPLEPEHINQLVYVRQVVNETMRLYPPAPIISRTTLNDIDVGGVRLPAGSSIIVPIYAVHRHKALWGRPDVFDPDRFAPEAVKGRHRYAFMPFGAGPRICIGSAFAAMEAVAILAVLARAVRLDRVAAAMPGATMKITLRPKLPLAMRITPR